MKNLGTPLTREEIPDSQTLSVEYVLRDYVSAAPERSEYISPDDVITLYEDTKLLLMY